MSRPRLGLDVTRRLPHGFISHAHFDHMAAHELAYCTPATARLYKHRVRGARQVFELPLQQPRTFADVQLTTYPAGHCLGSAMLLAEGVRTPVGDGSLLYTGDFKLGESATAEQARLPTADVLLMETTFGRPEYRLPPRQQVVEQLIALVRDCLAAGRTPVVHAYELGKSQEVTKLLTQAGISVMQHSAICAVSQVYQQCGVDLGIDLGDDHGTVRCYDANEVEGHAVVTLPKRSKHFRLPGLIDPVSIATTGWAVNEQTAAKWGVDHALPLSDHADFDQLVRAVEQVAPRQVYCTHGPVEFVDHLRSLGHQAFDASKSFQTREFSQARLF